MTLETIYEIGESVEIIGLECTGRVISVWITNAGTEYEVRYIFAGEQKKAYFFGDEIEREVKP